MKKPTRPINLTYQGKDKWEETEEFSKKVNEIRREVLHKYSLILSTEENWFKRQIIKTRRWLETKKRIDEISSWENLHVVSQ